jgi:DNA-directed RNA polymerase sigma subunit (sigma70/sigma32)
VILFWGLVSLRFNVVMLDQWCLSLISCLLGFLRTPPFPFLVSVHAMLQKVNKARKDMMMEIGRVPSDPELAHYMKVSVEELRKIATKSQNVVSLESPVRRGGSSRSDIDRRTIGESIASDAPTPEEDAQQQYLQRDIRIVINELAERERDVLVLRFGLENGEPLSTSQTALQLGITIDRVRLVEARALNKLRSPQRNYRLKEYVVGHVEEDDHCISSPVPGHSHDINNFHNQHQNNRQAATEKLWFF